MTINKIPNRLSKIFQPITPLTTNIDLKRHALTSKSQKLMLELGIIKQANPGCFHLLPLGLKSLNKLINLVDKEMIKANGQKIVFPTLINSNLWKQSKRLEAASKELFMLKDRHDHSYILSPTHEEVATDLLASFAPVSYKQFPLRLYQITNKFRDEMKPKFGLIRGRQFIMKDMYSFDIDLENAKKSYNEICNVYESFFKALGVPYTKVLGNSGDIGGLLSHEYHFLADIGEDKILSCAQCNYKANVELKGGQHCPGCGAKDITIQNGIEVGHTFLLGDRYSKPLNAACLGKNGKPHILQMGSYGLGLTRILAGALEVSSTENELRWPKALAPFTVLIIPPKAGSIEEPAALSLIEKLYSQLLSIKNLENDILLDDQTHYTIGKRFLDAKRVGYSCIVILGQKIVQNPPLFEVNNLVSNEQLFLSENEIIDYIKKNFE